MHRIGEDLVRPSVHRDLLTWRPWPGAPELEIGVKELVRPLE